MLVWTVQAQVQITEAAGWLETAYAQWLSIEEAKGYHAYVLAENQDADTADSWTLLDRQLVRDYGTYGRVDALGLRAGEYRLRIVPVDASNQEITELATETDVLRVLPHDRTGYAHKDRPTEGVFEGVGAYRNDGTLKDGAIVLYVNANNAATMTLELQYTAERRKTYTGIQTIIDGYRKCWAQGTPQPALCIRLIGLVKAADVDKFLSSGEGIAIKGETAYSELPLTLEGVGTDATIWGFGLHISQCVGVEVRNLGIMLCMDDALSVAQYNSHIWMHHNDIFYGQVGKDADQVKGDGSIDIKLSQYCTVSANHFFDCGKCSLIDAKSVTEGYADYLTYHHNWFDHTDQRNPRCRNGHAFHIYNNYYDGIALYGIGMACGSSAFAEGNYFRQCRYPVIASAQGTDKNLVNSKQSTKGLLSGENGGICKWWDNYTEGAQSLLTQHDMSSTSADVYAVSTRSEQVPASFLTLKGSTVYSNFDTNPAEFYTCTPDAPDDVPALVTGHYGAGRCQQGDFRWHFDNATEDGNSTLIPALKSALEGYLSTLVGYYGESIRNGGGTAGSAIVHLSDEQLYQRPYYDLHGRRSAAPRPNQLMICNGKILNIKE